MEQRVHEDPEIDFLYSLLRLDPDFLHAIDRKQFSDTPLHLAASRGRTQVALEIHRLMPSFGRKLNPDGYSPVDLALRWGHVETVSALIRLNPELVRVQGREGITPLHYTAGTGLVDLLAEFLLSCPDSIEDLTIRGESAVHVAVKNGKLAAFKVLLGWLKRTDRTQVLGWRDLKGNTVLHLAASTNQPEVMELLINHVCVNDKNSRGFTALDMVMELPPEENGKALQILHRRRAKRGLSIPVPGVATFADYLSSGISAADETTKFSAYLHMGLTGEMRSAVLVVAALIIAATYQAVLSYPAGGVADQTPIVLNISGTHNSSSIPGADNGNAKARLAKDDFYTFMLLNSIACAASVGMILLVIPIRRYNLLLHMSLLFLMQSYMVAMDVTSPPGTDASTIGIMAEAYKVLILIMLVKVMVFRTPNIVRASTRLIGSNNFYNPGEVMTLVFCSKYSWGKFDG